MISIGDKCKIVKSRFSFENGDKCLVIDTYPSVADPSDPFVELKNLTRPIANALFRLSQIEKIEEE